MLNLKTAPQQPQRFPIFLLLLLVCCFLTYPEAAKHSVLPDPEAKALLGFQSKADLRNHLGFSQNTTFHFCDWKGVTCYQQKVVRLIIEDVQLGGVFAPNTLSLLHQVRVLSLQNNSLTGPIPDLSALVNLKALYLDRNFFTGSFPPSVLSIHRIRTLDLSYNNLTGSIPTSLASLERLYYLRLEWNWFNGTIPPLNQSSLRTFNISGNNLTGAIPVTQALLRFGFSSFSWNPGLCGEIIHKECHPRSHFFGPGAAVAPPPKVIRGQSAQVRGEELGQPSSKKHWRTAVIIGFSTGVLVLVGSLLCFVMVVRKQKDGKQSTVVNESDDTAATAQAAAAIQMEQESELEEKVKKVQGMHVAKSGNLAFCAGEAQLYTLDQLMRASAELLGRGTMGSTYKAVLDNRLIVTVKRLDSGKLAATTKEAYEQHMESVGALRHPNLVPLRAYFRAGEERLLIYDYQPNGSLFSLIHGSKSTRAKPLHWTSCLKIAEDVAQGLAYIHQAWRLVHGNLKSTNVLLGPDLEACLTDYCLTALAAPSTLTDQDPDSIACKPPETHSFTHQATSKSDVHAFGVLLFELLTGKSPSNHPVLALDEMVHCLRTSREDDGGDEEQLGMLLEVAVACCLSSSEQRPTMWQVLKMLQGIKEAVATEDGEMDPQSGMS